MFEEKFCILGLMTIKISVENAGRENKPERNQARFDLKAIETLISKLENIIAVAPQAQQSLIRDALFAATPTLTELLTRHEVQSGDDIATIIEKLEAVKGKLEKEATSLSSPKEGQEIVREKVAANDNEGKREATMALQAKINELYQLNQQTTEQQDRLKEELVALDLFVHEKEAEIVDVNHTKTRIEHYQNAIQQLVPEETTGFLRGFLNRKSYSPEITDKIQELGEKIIKAEESLESKYHQLQQKEIRMQERLRILQSFLGEPVTEPDMISDWRVLVQQTRGALEKFIGKLEEEYNQRQGEIEASEHQRDSIASLDELIESA